ncbi:DUF6188 family protein [Nocardia sp. NBC_00511]|uniref:DUF6188 family protein n=1 Tax=Nocardia sp. NBC_00511 TaxID=2903591 RepID=UPI0030E0E189
MDLPITGAALVISSITPHRLVCTAGDYELHIEAELVVHSPDGPTLHRIPGEPDAEDLADRISGLITVAEVDEHGNLRIDLDTGRRLTVEPDRYFEAWNLSAPGRYLVVCMPGGELATWTELT